MQLECPSKQQLSGYVLGTLDEPSADSIGDHIDHCEKCEAAVEDLESESDPVINKLRAGPPEEPYANEAGLKKVEVLVAAIGREFMQSHQRASKQSSDTPDLGMLGQYQLLTIIGQGGMGTVYKALHTRLRRIVALKVLPSNRLDNEDAIARFNREMEVVGQLNHSNIVVAHDAGDVDGQHYLVMELVDGADLSTIIRKKGPLPVADACEIIRQTAEGLQHAHIRGMVHRDIKPSNLMLAKTDAGITIVKVLDMGLALLENMAPQQELTADGQVMGTLDYMAPEQGTDTHGVDIRADIYALGASLFKLLVGKTPFPADQYQSSLKQMMAKATKDAPSLGSLRNNVPPELVTLVDQMLARNPDERPANPAEVATALECFTQGSDLSALLSSADLESEEGKQPTRKHLTPESHAATSNPAEQQANDQRMFEKTVLSSLPDAMPLPRPQPLLRNPRFIGGGVVVLALAACFGMWYAGILFSVETEDGTILVEIDNTAKPVKVNITQGKTILIKDPNDGQVIKITVDPEKKQLLLNKQGFEVVFSSFSLESPDGRRVKVSFVPKNVVTKTESKSGDESTKISQATAKAERTAAEWVLRNGGYVQIEVGKLISTIMSIHNLPDESFYINSVFLTRRRGLVGSDFTQLSGLSNLRNLSVWETDVDAEVIPHIVKIPNLSSLNLAYTKVRSSSLLPLRSLRNLLHLTVPGGELVDDDWEAIRALTSVRWISISGGTEADARQLATIPHLRMINFLDLTVLEKETIALVAERNPLCRLVVRSNSKVSSQSAVGIDHVRELARDLHNLGAEIHLNKFENVQVISIDTLEEPAPFHLSGLTLPVETRLDDNLRRRLTVAGLGYCNAIGQQETDGLAKSLSDQTLMWKITLWKSDLTDTGLQALARLPNLKLLDIRETQVTPIGVAAFRRINSDCQVIWDGPEIELETTND